MEHSYNTECSEALALILERGHKTQRNNLLHAMTYNNRLCEAVVISLRALTKFNHVKRLHEGKK